MNKPSSCKVCKSVDTKLFLKAKKCFTSACPVDKKIKKLEANKKNRKTSQFSQAPRAKLFLTQMLEKRKVLYRYNITFSQLKKYFLIAKKKNLTIDNILESRLDSLVYRSGLVPNVRTARQIISHGYVKVNDSKCDISSRLIKDTDSITVLSDKHIFNLSIKPSWINVVSNVISLSGMPRCEEKFINFVILSEFISRYV